MKWVTVETPDEKTHTINLSHVVRVMVYKDKQHCKIELVNGENIKLHNEAAIASILEAIGEAVPV